jgi:hypothetical protein
MLYRKNCLTKYYQYLFKLTKKSSSSILFSIICLTGFSQSTKTFSTSITGSAMLSTDGKSVFFNMGGPGIKLSAKNWSTSISMIPSLRFFEDDPRPIVTPLLGVGLNVSYKRWVLGFPCYYLASKSMWILSVGAGVRLGK